MKRAEELFVFIQSSLFGEEERDVSDNNDTTPENEDQDETDETESALVQQLNDRFAIRDQVLLKQRQIVSNTETTTSIVCTGENGEISIEEVITESSIETSCDNANLTFVSIFGGKDREPTITNWNGEFKG